ncbi:hypothetical protein QJS10_CPB13g01675 [Acorus calamus]|uniref:Uncharacterized protein n=1 Tax=Acorus calamus TaxID=4465 RepID=A0AAV9DFI4_ACOCL|nr:hypothetical protein QJS10_CPB13g01675 [Acorus calamus]
MEEFFGSCEAPLAEDGRLVLRTKLILFLAFLPADAPAAIGEFGVVCKNARQNGTIYAPDLDNLDLSLGSQLQGFE